MSRAAEPRAPSTATCAMFVPCVHCKTTAPCMHCTAICAEVHRCKLPEASRPQAASQ